MIYIDKKNPSSGPIILKYLKYLKKAPMFVTKCMPSLRNIYQSLTALRNEKRKNSYVKQIRLVAMIVAMIMTL